MKTITGTIFTARDRAHPWLLKHNFKPLYGGVLYHCGPLVKKTSKGYKIVSAGPTTSQRMEKYLPELAKKYQLKAIIGKGGISAKTRKNLGKTPYLQAIGGGGALYAKHFAVSNVYNIPWGMPEAIWELEAKDMPVFD